MKPKRIAPIVIVVAILTVGGALLVRSTHNRPTREEPGSPPRLETPSRDALLPKKITEAAEPESSESVPAPEGELRVRVTAEGSAVSGARILVLFPAARLRRESVTDAEGNALFPNIPIGEWGIGVRHSRYIPAGAEAVVREGKTAEVEIELKQGALLRGRVTEADGAAIPGVKVYLCNTGEQIAPLGQGLEAKTDEAGFYRIDGIPVRGVVILFTSPRHKPLQDRHEFTYAGEEVEVDARLVEGNVIKGRVTDEGGIALEGVSVTARNELAKATTTDERGRFAIYALGEDSIHLSASRPGFGTVYLHDIAPNTLDLVVRLPLPGSIRGNIVTDPAPLPKWFAVNLWRFDPYYKRDIRVRTATFEGGGTGFLLENVTPGEYVLKVLAPPDHFLDKPIPVTVTGGGETSGVLVPLRKN